MARVNRREILADGDVQVVHCINRCVRRGFLCGDDPVSGKNYDHRRQWIQNRLEFLAGVFGVELLAFSVMSNHFHCVLRTRPDVVEGWSDEEIARRWWRLFPQRRNENGSPADPTDADLLAIHGDEKVLTERRLRLSSVSWFMRCTSEVIARMSNAEDECTGRFWEGRFKAKVLDSEEAIAACMVYVDLHPVRAGIADSPENSNFTSVQARMSDAKSADEVTTPDARDSRTEHGSNAGWLSPIPLQPQRQKVRTRKSSRRVSNKGSLPMSLSDYLLLVEWTGRQLHAGKRGYIKGEVPPLLDRLGTSPAFWLDSIRKLEPRYHVQSQKRSLTNTMESPTSSSVKQTAS